MDQDSYIPKELQFLIKTISQYSSNEIQLITTAGQNACNPSQGFSITFPENSLVDLDSLTWYGQMVTAGAACNMPPAECLIDSIEVKAGGVPIDRVDYNGDLFTHMRNVSSTSANSSNRAFHSFDTPRLLPVMSSTLLLTTATNAVGNVCGTEFTTYLTALRAEFSAKCNLKSGTGFVTIAAGAQAIAADWQGANDAAAIITRVAQEYVVCGAAVGITRAFIKQVTDCGDTTASDVSDAVYTMLADLKIQLTLLMQEVIPHCPYVASGLTVPFLVNSWQGFIGSCSHRLLDTSTMPQLSLTLTLAPNAILGGSAATYTIAANSSYFTLKVVQFPKYQKMLYAALGSGMPIRYNFTKWTNLSRSLGATDTNLTYQISASNLKRIFYTQKAAAFQTQALNTGFSDAVPYFTYARGASDGMWWSVDNVRKPQYNLDLVRYGYHHLLKALGRNGDTTYDNLIENQHEFNNYKFLQAIDFGYLGPDKGVVSGLDTMNRQATIALNLATASGAAMFAYFFNEQSAELQVMNGKVVSVSS
jgi:hypothetical protein